MGEFTADEIGYLARHLFLPPQLPQQDDSTPNYDNVLLRLVRQTLDDFVKQSDPEPSRTSRIVTSAISHLAILRNLDGSVNGSKLAEAFKSLTTAEIGKSSCPSLRIQVLTLTDLFCRYNSSSSCQSPECRYRPHQAQQCSRIRSIRAFPIRQCRDEDLRKASSMFPWAILVDR